MHDDTTSSNTTLFSCLGAALAYLARGFSVIPIDGATKKPLLDWKVYQTERADEATVRDWFQKWPNAGVGIVTGAISGIVVVDVDPGRGGRESMGKLIQEGSISREDLQTPTVRTQSGGVHLYYARPQLVGNAVDLLPGIDIRGDGGYVVAPPTQRDAEHAWRWMDGRGLELPLRPLPSFFLRTPPDPNGTSRVLTRGELARLESGVSGGQRHEAMKKLAGHWCALRWGREAVWVAVVAWNAKNMPPLTDEELSAQFSDMWQRWGNPSQALELGTILEAAKTIQDKKALKLKLLQELQRFGEAHRLSGKDRAYWGEMFKIVAGFPVTTFKALIPLEIPSEDGVDAPAPELPPERIKRAEELLDDPAFLHKVLRQMKRCNMVGEESNALLIYLAATSRLLDDPLSLTIKGESSSGKSYVTNMALNFIPEEDKIIRLGLSKQALLYSKHSYQHKVLTILELPGMEAANYSIRTLQSEGKIAFEVTVKNPETNSFETDEITKEGPTAVIVTTVEATLDIQNETRHWDVMVDESTDQTQRILRAWADLDARMIPPHEELEPFIDAQRLLQRHKVWVPPILKRAIEQSIEATHKELRHRLRRDKDKLEGLIKTICLLHQRQRAIEDGWLVAGLADYYLACIVGGQAFEHSLSALTPQLTKLLTKVRELLNTSEHITNAQLRKELRWSEDMTRRYTRLAEAQGYILDISNNIHAKKFILGNTVISAGMPPIEAVANRAPELAARLLVINPLDGEVVHAEPE